MGKRHQFTVAQIKRYVSAARETNPNAVVEIVTDAGTVRILPEAAAPLTPETPFDNGAVGAVLQQSQTVLAETEWLDRDKDGVIPFASHHGGDIDIIQFQGQALERLQGYVRGNEQANCLCRLSEPAVCRRCQFGCPVGHDL